MLFQAVYYITSNIQIFTIFFLLCQNGYFFTFRKIKQKKDSFFSDDICEVYIIYLVSMKQSVI